MNYIIKNCFKNDLELQRKEDFNKILAKIIFNNKSSSKKILKNVHS